MTRPRLIVHQFDPMLPQSGGVDTCISDLVAYAPRDAEFDVVGITSDGSQIGRWSEIEHRSRQIRFFAVALNKSSRTIPFSARVAAGLARWRPRSAGVLQTHRVDVAAAAQGLLRRGSHIQFIHNPHGEGVGVTGAGSDSFWRFAPNIYRLVEARVLTKARRIIVFNVDEADRLKSMGYAATPWRTWFDPAAFTLEVKKQSSTLRIACIGRLERQKDPFLAAATVIELCRRGVQVEATFLGHGSMSDGLRKNADASGFGGSFRFAGQVGRESVAATLRESDVLLLSSHYEGSPRILIESLASGTPVAATASADPDCLVVDGVTGATAVQRTPADLANAVLSARGCNELACAAAVTELRADRVVPMLWEETDLAP